jgi:GH24 family phage-related lysozyme (muramidase)
MAAEQYGLPSVGAFKSYATDQAEFHRELVDFLLQHRRQVGTVVPSTGITKPYNRDSVSSVDDVFALADQWARDNKQRRGGSSFDMPLSPPTDTYRQRRYEFLSREEGIRTRAYDDATGLPVAEGEKVMGNVTVGIGFNMDREDARDVFKAATGLNDEDFDAVYKGKQRLSQEHIRKLFDYTALEAEKIVENKFKDSNISEHQRLALVSLAFNNPKLIGPNLTELIRKGDMAGARDEILFASNAKKDRGIAGRRYREAAMFVGSLDADAALPQFKDYIRNFA